jgi:hypothetical protein
MPTTYIWPKVINKEVIVSRAVLSYNFTLASSRRQVFNRIPPVSAVEWIRDGFEKRIP